jgi:hypothetical protein
MKRITLIAFIFFESFVLCAGVPSESLRQFIDNKLVHSCYEIDNEHLFSGNELPLFYMNRLYVPAWFNQDVFSNNGYILLNYIRQANQHGLQPNDYHLNLIEKYLVKMQQNKEETVRMKIPVDVVLIYLTAWTDGKDRIQFRKDACQIDENVLEALNQKPEASNNANAIL